MVDINITYETLYELLRNEKNREDLQELSPTFYTDVITYLRKTKKMLDEALVKNSSEEDKEDLLRQLKNIKNIIKELYERREKKIITLALHKSRSSYQGLEEDTMLPEELSYLREMTSLLGSYRKDILLRVLDGSVPVAPTGGMSAPINDTTMEDDSIATAEEPERTPEVASPKPPMESHTEPPQSAPASLSAESTPEPTPEVASPTEQAATNPDQMALKFKEMVPKFLGKELEVYGPFDPGDVAELPSELANVLIRKGKAEVVAQG